MKIGILLFLACCLATVSKSQSFILSDNFSYATIKDSDGYVNLRESPNNKAKITGKIYNYQVFNCEQTGTNWWKVEQINEHGWLDGYICKDRVVLLNWKGIKRRNQYADSGVFKKDSIRIVIKRQSFQPKHHKLTYEQHYIVKIDDKKFWGTDGPMPKKTISSIKIIKNDNILLLPRAAYDGLYEPNLASISVYSGPENTLYIRMDNSDGAGAYTVIWIFKDNKYLGRYIDNSLA